VQEVNGANGGLEFIAAGSAERGGDERAAGAGEGEAGNLACRNPVQELAQDVARNVEGTSACATGGPN